MHQYRKYFHFGRRKLLKTLSYAFVGIAIISSILALYATYQTNTDTAAAMALVSSACAGASFIELAAINQKHFSKTLTVNAAVCILLVICMYIGMGIIRI